MLDHDRAKPARIGGGRDRLDINQAQPERRRRDEDGGRPLYPFERQVRGTSRPCPRHTAVVVDRQRDDRVVVARRLAREQRGIEQLPRVFVGLGVRRHRLTDGGIAADRVGNAGYVRGHPGDRVLDALFEPHGGRPIVEAEAPELDGEAGEHRQRRCRAASGKQPRRAHAPVPRHERRTRRRLAHVVRGYTAASAAAGT